MVRPVRVVRCVHSCDDIPGHPGTAAGSPGELEPKEVHPGGTAGSGQLLEPAEEIPQEVDSVKGMALPDVVSIRQAADTLGVTYHCLLGWVKRDRYGLNKSARKVPGGGWIIRRDAVKRLAELRKRGRR